MEKTTLSKKELRDLIGNTMQEAIAKLELPEPGKKVKKLLGRNAKKIAKLFAQSMKRDNKKKEKAAKFLESAVKGKTKKTKKQKEAKVKLEEVISI